MFGEQKYTYFVSGRLYYRQYGASAGFEFPGLCDSVTLAIEQREINLPNTITPGGGNYDQIRRVESVGVTFNLREIKPSDLAEAIWGAYEQNTGDDVVDEAHTVTLGSFVPLAHGGTITAVSVTDDATSPATIDTDNYEVRPGGLWIKEDAPDLNDGDGILVSYTYPTYSRVQALTTSAPELEFWFDGENEARDAKNIRVKLHKVRLGAAAEIALLSTDDFGALQLEGEVLLDQTVTGDGLSQYFYVDIEN